ncbi:MAG: hypothetical protein HDS40_05265 [Bacteroides sp.]|nr:hypothetical protein [Bacteroides sp.]
MNSKIPFHQLSALLAEKCSITASEAEDFVRGFFDLVTETLIEGNEIKIKGIGTFKRSDDEELPVEFIPDQALADGINSPFAMFEPEELRPEVTESLLATEDDPTTPTDGTSEITADTTEIVVAEENPAEASPAEVNLPESPAGETIEVEQQSAAEHQTTEEDKPSEEVIDIKPAGETLEETDVIEEVTNVQASAEVTVNESVAPSEVTVNESVTPDETIVEPVKPEAYKPEPDESEVIETVSTEPEKFASDAVTTTIDTDSVVETIKESSISETQTTVTDNRPSSSVVADQTGIRPGQAPAAPSYDDEEDEYLTATPAQSAQSSWGWGFVIGLIVGMAIGACAVYFAIDYIFPHTNVALEQTMEADSESIAETEALLSELQAEIPAADSTDVAEMPQSNDTIAAQPTGPETAESQTATAETKEKNPAPQPETAPATPVKDTVKAGYLLPTMARKHYGDKSFWVYIYEENKAIITNPNRIRPGQTVVIPPASKYGIDAHNSESIRRAKDKAAEILKKYPN